MRDYVGDWRTKRENPFGGAVSGSYVGHRHTSVDLSGLKFGGEPLEDNAIVDYVTDENPERRGSQFGGSFKTGEWLEGLATPLTSAVSFADPQNSVAETFKAAMGGTHGAAGTTVVAAGTTTDIIEVAAGHGTRFEAGRIGYVTTTAGMEPFLVRKVVGDFVHLTWSLASIPANGVTVWNSASFNFDKDGYGIANHSLRSEFIGEDSNDQVVVHGCVPTAMEIGYQLGGLMSVDTTWLAAYADSPAAAGFTLGETVPVGGGPQAHTIGKCYFGTASVTDAIATRATLDIKSVKVMVGIAHTLSRGPAATYHTLYDVRMMRPRTRIEFEFSIERGSATWKAMFDDYAADARKYFCYMNGSAVASGGVGGVFAVAMPNARFAAQVPRGSGDGLVNVKVTLGGLRPLHYTGGTTARTRSPIVLGLG